MALIGEFGAAVRDADPNIEPDTFTFHGETFTVASKVGVMPLLRFASAADAGIAAEELEGLAAMHEMIRDCLIPGDWPRLRKVATDNKADAAELMEICSAIYRAVTARPTRPPSDSADGSSPTTASSRVLSSSEESSRPTWRDTPFGRRELAAHGELYQEIKPVRDLGRDLVLSQAG